MTPIDQTILHEPEKGRNGDCMRAMFASLFELPIEQVPHFLHDGCDSNTFHQRINDWLRPMNLGYLPVGACSPTTLAQYGIRGWFHEAYGQSPRGVQHACVACDGEVVHDPHPTKTGLQSVEGVGMLFVLDPSKPAGISRQGKETDRG